MARSKKLDLNLNLTGPKKRAAPPASTPAVQKFIEGEPTAPSKPGTATSTPLRQAQAGVRLVAYLPADLEQWVRVQAAVTRRSRSDIVTEALQKLRDTSD